MSYDGSAVRRARAEIRNNPLASNTKVTKDQVEVSGANWSELPDGKPDFERMTSAQRLVYDRTRLV